MLRDLLRFVFIAVVFVAAPAFAGCEDEPAIILKRIYNDDFHYITYRHLAEYQNDFAAMGFNADWLDMRADEAVIDMGTGDGNMPRELLENRHFKGKALGVTVAFPKDKATLDLAEANSKGRLKYLYKRLVENIPTEEFPKTKLITDVFGPFSYSTRPDLVLQKYMDILDQGGSAYIHYSPYHNFIKLDQPVPIKEFLESNRMSRDHFYRLHSTLQHAVDVDEKNVTHTPSFIQWLQTIDGIRVTGSIEGRDLKITKVAKKVQIPELTLEKIVDDGPPIRRLVPKKRGFLDWMRRQ